MTDDFFAQLCDMQKDDASPPSSLASSDVPDTGVCAVSPFLPMPSNVGVVSNEQQEDTSESGQQVRTTGTFDDTVARLGNMQESADVTRALFLTSGCSTDPTGGQSVTGSLSSSTLCNNLMDVGAVVNDDDEAVADASRLPIRCPFCGSTRTVNQGGATKNVSYAHSCEDCEQVWTQLRQPDETGDLRIRLSNRAVCTKVNPNPARRSGGYNCGVCGQKKNPQKGIKHDCPGIKVTDTPIEGDSSLAPLISTVQADAQAALVVNSMRLPPLVAHLVSPAGDYDDDVSLDGVNAMNTVLSTNPTASLSQVSHPPLPTPSTIPPTLPSVQTGRELLKLLNLVHKKVRGDGSCWVYAILAAFGLCEHAHPRFNRSPSAIDRMRDGLCRVMAHSYLQSNSLMLNLTMSDIANLDDILEMPTYPMMTDDDFGSFGSNLTVLGLVGYIKQTIVMWDNTTLDVVDAKQQVITWSGTRAHEFNMTPNDILQREYHHAIHILWNGTDHYTALVRPMGSQIDDMVYALLRNAVPLSNPPRPIKRRTTYNGYWDEYTNLVRPDPSASEEIENEEKLTSCQLKQMCLDKGYNAILHRSSGMTHMTTFLRFDFYLSEADCRKAGDFTSTFMLYRPSKKLKNKAPISGCTCDTHYLVPMNELSCNQCGRWVHVQCTPHADLPLDELNALAFVCSACQ